MKQLETINIKNVYFDYSRPLYKTMYKVTVKKTEKTKYLQYFQYSDIDSIEFTKTMLSGDSNLPYYAIKEMNKLIPDSYSYEMVSNPIECSTDIIYMYKCDYQQHFVTYYLDHDHFIII